MASVLLLYYFTFLWLVIREYVSFFLTIYLDCGSIWIFFTFLQHLLIFFLQGSIPHP